MSNSTLQAELAQLLGDYSAEVADQFGGDTDKNPVVQSELDATLKAILATVSKHLPEKQLHDIENGTKRYSDAGKDMWGNHYADLFNSKIDGRNTAITEMEKLLTPADKE